MGPRGAPWTAAAATRHPRGLFHGTGDTRATAVAIHMDLTILISCTAGTRRLPNGAWTGTPGWERIFCIRHNSDLYCTCTAGKRPEAPKWGMIGNTKGARLVISVDTTDQARPRNNHEQALLQALFVQREDFALYKGGSVAVNIKGSRSSLEHDYHSLECARRPSRLRTSNRSTAAWAQRA